MSEFNRYKFLKKMYSNYLVILLKNGKYKSYDSDLDLLKFNYYDLNKIRKRHISYIIIDNLKIIDLKKFNDNTYQYYLKIILIKRILDIYIHILCVLFMSNILT